MQYTNGKGDNYMGWYCKIIVLSYSSLLNYQYFGHATSFSPPIVLRHLLLLDVVGREHAVVSCTLDAPFHPPIIYHSNIDYLIACTTRDTTIRGMALHSK